MTDQIPLPPPDHTEDVHGFVHDTERRYYSEQTMRAYAERLHDARVKTLPTQLMAGLQAEVDALRHQLQTLAELGDASGDTQILRMGYAAARLEVEHLNTQLQAAREEIKRRDAQEEAIGAVRPLPWRWYSVDKDGLATLCLDREDAEKAAAEANADWPCTGPHRAVRLVELEVQLEAIGAGGVEPLRRRECLHKISEPAPAPANGMGAADARRVLGI